MLKHEAITRVVSQIGLQDYSERKADIRRVRLGSQSLPFLTGDLVGRETWRIEFSDSLLNSHEKESRYSNQYVKKLVVLLAPETNHVMTVVSRWPEDVPCLPQYPCAAEEERQMRASKTTYDGLPRKAPRITLLEALGATIYWSEDVKQIIASYVLETTLEYLKRPVWVFQLRGFPPFDVHGPLELSGDRISVHARNHLREVVDAQTGEWLGGSTIPQPTLAIEDRI